MRLANGGWVILNTCSALNVSTQHVGGQFSRRRSRAGHSIAAHSGLRKKNLIRGTIWGVGTVVMGASVLGLLEQIGFIKGDHTKVGGQALAAIGIMIFLLFWVMDALAKRK